VNLVKFTENIDVSRSDGSTDYTNLSKDCFHLSQKGHSKKKTCLHEQALKRLNLIFQRDLQLNFGTQCLRQKGRENELQG
jgi:hypothetical protein